MRHRILTSSAVFAIVLANAVPCRADTITIDSPRVNLVALADTLTLNGNVVSVDLDHLDGKLPLSFGIQTADFVVGNSGLASQDFPFIIPRQITVAGVTRDLSSQGLLSITPAFDRLALFGATTTFDLSMGRTVTVTVNPMFFGATVHTGLQFEVTATLTDVAATPEPATFALLGTGFVGLFARARIKRHPRMILR